MSDRNFWLGVVGTVLGMIGAAATAENESFIPRDDTSA